MQILAFEFSALERSVAVAGGAASGHVPERVSQVIEVGSSASGPLAMAEEALRQAGVERERVERVVVGLGPGSYTGIRSAIALAQGWQLAREVRLLGLSSAQCIAEQALGDGVSGRIAVVIDAQRGEFYLGIFDLEGSAARELEPLRLASPDQVADAEQRGALLVGPQPFRAFPKARIVQPRAATLARMAWGRKDSAPGETLRPIYLRETQFVKAPPARLVA
jgi:tRNA threonylcarbamoyl adenosine modification protein YeaZ